MTMHRFFIASFFITLGLLVVAKETPAVSPAVAARGVLERFCELDTQGKQLTPGDWPQIAALFVTPGVPRLDKIIVVRDFVVSRPALEGSSAEFYVEYIQLGEIDPKSARFSGLPPVKVRAGFDLVLTAKPPELGPSGTVRRTEGHSEWRIKGPVPEPHLMVSAAISYATGVRAKAPDTAIKSNAERTIAALKRLL